MVEIIYFLIPAVALSFIFLGFRFNEKFTGLFGALLLFLFGVIILIAPINGLTSLANDSFGSISWGYGSYLILRTTYEQYNQ